MPIRQLEWFRYRCDRCHAEAIHQAADPVVDLPEGWTSQRGPHGTHWVQRTVLCPDCSEKGNEG
jgi:DNA-directed RNA polymerase subunit RPC12/RpoP